MSKLLSSQFSVDEIQTWVNIIFNNYLEVWKQVKYSPPSSFPNINENILLLIKL